MENLEHTQVAEQERSTKGKFQNRRQVQKGGVIYASEERQCNVSHRVTAHDRETAHMWQPWKTKFPFD